jgi:sigma-E factor negative regulatory protein RseA
MTETQGARPMNESPNPTTDPARWLELSGFVDGEGREPRRPITAAWSQDAELRERWHAWHLIGEVLRSDDAPADPGGDAAFLAGFRRRLAKEPATAVSMPTSAGGRIGGNPVQLGLRNRLAHLGVRAMAPLAAAAAAAALVLWLGPVGRPAFPDRGADPALTGVGADRSAAGAVAAAAQIGPQGAMTSRVALRDSGLDPYLSAHRLGAQGSATWPATSVAHPADVVVEYK